MKSRRGFVSNSSSSNFIIHNDNNIIELAKDMIACRHYHAAETLNKFTELLKNNNTPINIPIMFSSINYETYLYPIGNDIYIDTCNNEDWSAALDIRDCQSRGEEDEDTSDSKPYFWDIERDLLVKMIGWYKRKDLGIEWCKTCSTEPYYIFDNNTIMCPRCYSKKFPEDTFTKRNNPTPKIYNGPNIRRYQYTRSF